MQARLATLHKYPTYGDDLGLDLSRVRFRRAVGDAGRRVCVFPRVHGVPDAPPTATGTLLCVLFIWLDPMPSDPGGLHGLLRAGTGSFAGRVSPPRPVCARNVNAPRVGAASVAACAAESLMPRRPATHPEAYRRRIVGVSSAHHGFGACWLLLDFVRSKVQAVGNARPPAG